MKRSIYKKWWFWILVVLLITILYPKQCGYTYGGFLKEGVTVNREECSCFGVKYESFSRIPPSLGGMIVTDSGKNQYCVGFPVGKTCYESTFDPRKDLEDAEIQVECKK